MSAALHKAAQILCPYCDHEYRPADYSAKGMQQALMLHVRDCPTHPIRELRDALEESVKLQSHYAELLNMHDGGARLQFANADAWLARLSTLRAAERKSKTTARPGPPSRAASGPIAQPQRGGQKLAQRVSAGLAATNDSSPSGAAQEAACNAPGGAAPRPRRTRTSGAKRSDKNK